MKPRSPIEMMVDKACGFDPNAPQQPAPTLDDATQALLAVADAAVAWYRAVNVRRRKNVDAELDALESAVQQWLKAIGEEP